MLMLMHLQHVVEAMKYCRGVADTKGEGSTSRHRRLTVAALAGSRGRLVMSS